MYTIVGPVVNIFMFAMYNIMSYTIQSVRVAVSEK